MGNGVAPKNRVFGKANKDGLGNVLIGHIVVLGPYGVFDGADVPFDVGHMFISAADVKPVAGHKGNKMVEFIVAHDGIDDETTAFVL